MQYLIDGIVSFSLLAPACLGFYVLFTSFRFFNFAHGAIIPFGAYALYVLEERLDWPLFGLAALSLVLCGLMGGATSLLLSPATNRQQALRQLLLSIGLYISAIACIQLFFHSDTKIAHSWDVEVGTVILCGRITAVQSAVVCVSIGTALLTWGVWDNTTAGRRMRCLGNNFGLAKALGIPVRKTAFIAGGLAAALGGLSGILISLESGAQPTMGLRPLLLSAVAAVVGEGRYWGTLSLLLLLTLLNSFCSFWMAAKWGDTVVFLLLLVFLAIRSNRAIS